MSELNLLSRYLEQLRSYDDGIRLKAEAMQEVDRAIRHLGMSRREFTRAAERLGLSVPSSTSLGNWISCRHIPTADNVDRLLEALLAVLHERGHTDGRAGGAWHGPLREASLMHDHGLTQFRRDAQNLERAKELLDSVIAWLDLTDFPPMTGAWPASFVPLTREHGMQCLEILRRVHFDAAENSTQVGSIEHELLASKAAITLSHYLNICGQYRRALEVADEGSYVLGEILQKFPQWRDFVVDGHTCSMGEPVTLGDLEIMGLGRKAGALHALSQLAQSTREANNLRAMVRRTLALAIERSDRLAGNVFLCGSLWRIWATVDLDNARNTADLEQAAHYARRAMCHIHVADSRMKAVTYYVTQLVEIEALARSGQIGRAGELLEKNEAMRHQIFNNARLQPGPGHQVIYWRSVGTFWWARALREPLGSSRQREYSKRCRDAMTTGLDLAHRMGFSDSARRLQLIVNKMGPDFHRLPATPDA